MRVVAHSNQILQSDENANQTDIKKPDNVYAYIYIYCYDWAVTTRRHTGNHLNDPWSMTSNRSDHVQDSVQLNGRDERGLVTTWIPHHTNWIQD